MSFYKYFEHSGRILYNIVSRLESLCLWTRKIWQGSLSPPTIRSPLQRLCPSRTLRVLTRALSSLCHWTVCAKLSLPDRSLFELEIWNKLQAECKFSMLILSYNLWIWRNGCRYIYNTWQHLVGSNFGISEAVMLDQKRDDLNENITMPVTCRRPSRLGPEYERKLSWDRPLPGNNDLLPWVGKWN